MSGSPPHVRGKVGQTAARNQAERITPAYAGKSRKTPTQLRKPRDHPRVCGEKFAAMFESMFIMGSPPRMRGKARPPANIKKSSRITPAYAGKRISGTMQTTIRQGSPPRMRGKGSVLACRDQVLGITPAYAGKSSGHTVRSGTNGDHPRVCGEKTKKIP